MALGHASGSFSIRWVVYETAVEWCENDACVIYAHEFRDSAVLV
jgi:hypothetical protein